MTRISDFLTSGAERAASRQQSKKTHTEKVGESRSPKQMTKDAKKAQKKATKEAGKGFKDSFKDTACSVKSAGKTLVNATGINGKQKKEQAVDKIYGITRGIGTTIAHPIKTAKEIASGIRKKAKEKGESYVGGYILGEVTQTVAAAGAAAAAGKGLKGANAAKNTKLKKKNGLADAGSKTNTKPYTNSRPSFRKGVVEEVWENAKGPDGLVRDPNTGEVINWTPGESRKGVWDMGHIPEAKYSEMHEAYMNGELTTKEFVDWYNDPANYRPELPSKNRSHKYE